MPHLNSPLQIRNLHLSNRIVLPPMATSKADADGRISQDLLDYYDEKSRGGHVGLIITEHSYVCRQGIGHPGQLSAADDSVLDGYQSLAEVVHRNGSKIIAQINHAGSAARQEVTGCEVVAPSAVTHPNSHDGVVPRALKTGEIQDLVRLFAKSAKMVQAAGFDGVEIHSAHGYLLNQFYSPLTNKRMDSYGGSLEMRIRIHLEVIRAVREQVGPDFAVLLRLGGSDYQDGGSTIDDAVQAAQAFEAAGVDMLDISGGLCGFVVPELEGQGYFKAMTQAIRRAVSIPVILTGGITDAKAADDLISHGYADLVGIGRAMLKDSGWAKKALADIR